MPLSQIKILSPPDLDVTQLTGCGPSELAEIVLKNFHLSAIGGQLEGAKLPASDQAARDLLRLTYFASLKSEEKRPIRPWIVLGPEDATLLPLRVVYRFSAPLSLSDSMTLVKLAPALPSDRCALWVVETQRNGQHDLYAIGVLDGAQFAYPMLGMHRGFVPLVREGTLMNSVAAMSIHVEGPGDMRVGLGFRTTVLQAGEIRQLTSLDRLPYNWSKKLEYVSSQVVERVAKSGKAGVIYVETFHHDVSVDLAWWWSDLLNFTIERHHGGTFILLPPDFTEDGAIQHGYPVEFSLAERLIDFHVACAMTMFGHHEDPNAFMNGKWNPIAQRWIAAKGALIRAIEVISSFANVDGCVVLDANLNVLSFGSKLKNMDGPRLPLVDWHVRSESLEPEMIRLGTRRTSFKTILAAA